MNGLKAWNTNIAIGAWKTMTNPHDYTGEKKNFTPIYKDILFETRVDTRDCGWEGEIFYNHLKEVASVSMPSI